MDDDGRAEPTIYDVARAAGVAPSTVSRALSKPGRVSFRTAEHVRRVADELGYRSGRMELPMSDPRHRGAGVDRGRHRQPCVRRHDPRRRAGGVAARSDAGDHRDPGVRRTVRSAPSRDSRRRSTGSSWRRPGCRIQGFGPGEAQVGGRAEPHGGGGPLGGQRQRAGDQEGDRAPDRTGHASICYLAGPEASYANGMRWRGLKEAGHELDLQVRRSARSCRRSVAARTPPGGGSGGRPRP